MSAFRVDGSFADHPKVVALDDGPCRGDAIALWVLAGSWVRRWNLEGFIPHAQVKRFAFKPRAADELVRVGLWEESPDGYRFHDWFDRNPTRAKEEVGRAKANARVKAHRKRKSNARVTPLHMAHVTHSETPPVTPDETGGVTPLHRDQRSGTDLSLNSGSFQGNSAEIAEVAAVLDPARRPATAAAAGRSSNGEAQKVTSETVARAWAKTIAKPNAGCPGTLHSHRHWREDFEVIATACNAVEGKPLVAMVAVIEWFWLGPNGPVQAGRVPRAAAEPSVLAARVGRDLDAAQTWWIKQREAERASHHHEAAQ